MRRWSHYFDNGALYKYEYIYTYLFTTNMVASTENEIKFIYITVDVSYKFHYDDDKLWCVR